MSFNLYLVDLYKFLFGSTDINNNIIRKHTRNLEELGDLSFPLNAFKFIPSNTNTSLLNTCPKEDLSTVIVSNTLDWKIPIVKCKEIKNDLHLFLSRSEAFQTVICKVNNEKDKYGIGEVLFKQKIHFKCEINENMAKIDLTQLRAILLKKTTETLYNLCNLPQNHEQVEFVFATSGNMKDWIICGPILDGDTLKKSTVTADEFFKKRIVDMRLMAEHKYGLRATKQTNWLEMFEKLGKAAVIIELLQNNPTQATVINFQHTTSSSKGAPFILYNCARLATLFRDYEKKVNSGCYPPLPIVEHVDFNLLKQPEEWELLYVYIMQFPLVIVNCIDIVRKKIHMHALCNHLSGMCSIFSVYYRRIKVLTEPREHLLGVLNARIYLLKAMECVLHTSLGILNIDPVNQM